ncbi:MAG: hypothetical protein L6R48_13460 [Planctomycetes bacterium]|nr:hypothetical protein [Planctomycetota bacterium]
MSQDPDLIASYSRDQALADGVLVDVSDAAGLLGFRRPVALTAGVWGLLGGTSPDDVQVGLLVLLLWLRAAIKGAKRGQDRIRFTHRFHPGTDAVALVAACGPGDDASPVIALMLPGED